MHGFGIDGWPMGWGGWWMLLFWLGIVALAIWGLRMLVSDSHPATERRAETARDIAERRYARGEISREEFLDLISDLESVEALHKAKRSEHQ